MQLHSQALETLEQSLFKTQDFLGTIGVSLNFTVTEHLKLRLNVRVLDDKGQFIERVPYSMAFTSACCGELIQADYSNEDTARELVCDVCGAEQSWAPTLERLSVLGSGRGYSKTLIAEALESLDSLDPLSSTFLAEAMLHDVELFHDEHLTPAWGLYLAEQIWDYYGHPEAQP